MNSISTRGDVPKKARNTKGATQFCLSYKGMNSPAPNKGLVTVVARKGITCEVTPNVPQDHGDFTPLVYMTYACPVRMTKSGHLKISASRRSIVLYSIPIERSHDNGCTLPSQNFEIRTSSPYCYP